MKLELDKYYTPKEIATYCTQQAVRVIGQENITDVIEPSIGNGSFITDVIRLNKGIDVEPQVVSSDIEIVKGDYLTMEIPYKRGRLILGNPPYGRCLNLAQKFYDKSVEIADYIAFILPISQLNNTRSMYKFDLLLSLDLGEERYTDRTLHCCFNVYARPKNGLNKKPTTKSKNIRIIRQDSRTYEDEPYDIRMCYWGNGSAGKILQPNEHYSAEYKIQILNPQYKQQIIDVMTTFDWKEYLNCIAMRKIQQFHIIDVLRENIKGFE